MARHSYSKIGFPLLGLIKDLSSSHAHTLKHAALQPDPEIRPLLALPYRRRVRRQRTCARGAARWNTGFEAGPPGNCHAGKANSTGDHFRPWGRHSQGVWKVLCTRGQRVSRPLDLTQTGSCLSGVGTPWRLGACGTGCQRSSRSVLVSVYWCFGDKRNRLWPPSYRTRY